MTLYIIRGLPGSGKSTLARLLLTAHTYHGDDDISFAHSMVWCEADQYFIDENGYYIFDATKLKDAHNWCQDEARKALEAGLDVVVSNTFTQNWEMEPYFKMARDGDHHIQIIECHGNYKSVHNVPEVVINSMRSRWEPIACDIFV